MLVFAKYIKCNVQELNAYTDATKNDKYFKIIIKSCHIFTSRIMDLSL